MKLSRWTIALYVGLVFASGAVVGAYSHRFFDVTTVSASASRSPEEFRKRFHAEMLTRLKLTPDQVSKLDGVLNATQAEFQTTRESIVPALAKIREEQHQRILALLDPGQQAEYEKMRQEREARSKQLDSAGNSSR
jgi:excinuclease UvrABC helicase subunit UvrB